MKKKKTDYIKTCYLVFSNGTHWTNKFEKNEFGHVYVLENDGYNWYTISGTDTICRFNILPIDNDVDVVKRLLSKNNISILEVQYIEHGSDSLLRIEFQSCVSMAKYYIGLKSWVFTPYQLYKQLLKFNHKKRRFKSNVINVKPVEKTTWVANHNLNKS